ncbi:hypothetical protein [Thermaerobacillus caldiproteolyticus]|uniref:Uncharacterized protein n=1 Tax=Thermaerobacillus caldiproteolyticus TaxID=247480 RepID=A0A7W0BYZ3_9BACL|nr:hypothetical protein [Anoxybacillus caldiproteolyticus]MBA2875483.1 hypothetical protein [Anoxybacillus caldiproteolyticus]QPA32726.1 hypothetical protein ISX45_07370 [Anoxybacillus caldiproteolyticus]
MSRFHACATCIHYGIRKSDQGLYTYCQRLGYETKPYYQFRCWTPKPHVQALMEKEQQRKENQNE